ncbi:DUF6493 family protein [Lentzea sp. NPDC058450]|uniref:DUF6493 family protein n=1 Tax=Lentzea sp. NPDC058450 TaxID=3346505 RepID=UPI00364F6E6E
MTFGRIQALIESDQLLALGEVLKSLTPDERKACAKDLVAYGKQHRASRQAWQHHAALHIAGCGLLPNASTLAPWLVRYQIWWNRAREDSGIPVALDVLRHRDLTWMPDLVTRVAARTPNPDRRRRPDLLRLVLEFCGDTPPDTDGFLLHFLEFGGHTRWSSSFDVLIPRMLEVVGSGAIFVIMREWRLFLRDRADRTVLLDGVLARLQQGGRAREMEGFLALHEVLQVTVDEVTEHARDYVAMLPDSRTTVATLAQQELKRADEAGGLDFELLADASRWVFGRSDKKLIRAQLTWLGKHAKSTPDGVALAAAELFAHESDDLRGQAVKLIVKTNVSAATRAELLTLAEQLPPDLAAQLGVETEADEVFALAAHTAGPWPGPIATLDELTGEVRALLGRSTAYLDPVAVERIVEAVVRFAWQDREAAARAVEPILDQYSWIRNRLDLQVYLDRPAPDARSTFFAIIAAVSAPAESFDQNAVLGRTGPESPARHLAKRLREIARGLVRSPRPLLVSTPTDLSWQLDPAILLERLAKAEAEGWEPWPGDLQQACRRLPRDTAPEYFASLGGTTGVWLREWLADVYDPVAELVVRTRAKPYGYIAPPRQGTRTLATLPELTDPERFWYGYNEWEVMAACWPGVLPRHREVVAAHLVPQLAVRCESKGDDGPLLPLLVETHGPIGPATHLALAYGLGAEAAVARAHSVDALLVLAARGQLDGTALGEVLGTLVERGGVSLSRVVPGLRDVARSGAAAQIWDLLVVALPKVWAHNRVADVVELAVELAQGLQPGGRIEGLAEVAARKGSSKTVVQARRLARALGES